VYLPPTGFGDLDGEYWLGLDAVQAVARPELQELLVRMVYGDVVYLALPSCCFHMSSRPLESAAGSSVLGRERVVVVVTVVV
jgi:hypothetical protein